MSGDVNYGYCNIMNEGTFNEPGASSRDRQTASKKIEKGLKRLLILAAIIMGAQFIWFFVISPCIPLSTLEVRGFNGLDGMHALDVANIGEGSSFISVNAADAQQRLASHHLVESARVVKRFPDRLSIFLEPRRAVALSLAVINGSQVPMYIDRHGVVFEIGSFQESTGSRSGLPILSGLTYENPTPGMKFPAAFIPLLEDISRISNSAPELLAALSEIRLNRKAHDDFDLVIYPIHSSIRVRLEKNLTEDILRYVMLMLDVFESRFPKPEEIDFRSGVGSYRIKEAPSGE